MGKKLAFALSLMLLVQNINAVNVLASIDEGNNNSAKETSALSAEPERQSRREAEILSESRDGAKIDEEVPAETGKEESAVMADEEAPPKASPSENGDIPQGESRSESRPKEQSQREEDASAVSMESSGQPDLAAANGQTEAPQPLAADKAVAENAAGSVRTGAPGKEEVQAEEAEEKEDLQAEEPGEKESRQVEDAVYNVLLPASTRAYLDPGNLSGRGQIFSDKYEVENYGSTDIAIKINNIEISCASKEDADEPVWGGTFTGEEESAAEKLNVEMVWENESKTGKKILHVADGSPDEYVLWLKAAGDGEEEAENFGGGGRGFFYFSGTIDASSAIDWENQEIRVVFHYEITNGEGLEKAIRWSEDEEQEENDMAAGEAGRGMDGGGNCIPETNAQEAKGLETNAKEVNALESINQEANAKEANTLKTNTQEANAPETNTQKANAPETNIQKANAPETNTQETNTQETNDPESKALERNVPEPGAQEAKVPETKAMETGGRLEKEDEKAGDAKADDTKADAAKADAADVAAAELEAKPAENDAVGENGERER